MKTSTGLQIFHVNGKPVGSGVMLSKPLVLEGETCVRQGCSNQATTTLSLGISTCSPSGFNTAFLYEDNSTRPHLELSVCEVCKEDQKDGQIFMVDDSLREGPLSRVSFYSICLGESVF